MFPLPVMCVYANVDLPQLANDVYLVCGMYNKVTLIPFHFDSPDSLFLHLDGDSCGSIIPLDTQCGLCVFTLARGYVIERSFDFVFLPYHNISQWNCTSFIVMSLFLQLMEYVLLPPLKDDVTSKEFFQCFHFRTLYFLNKTPVA